MKYFYTLFFAFILLIPLKMNATEISGTASLRVVADEEKVTIAFDQFLMTSSKRIYGVVNHKNRTVTIPDGLTLTRYTASSGKSNYVMRSFKKGTKERLNGPIVAKILADGETLAFDCDLGYQQGVAGSFTYFRSPTLKLGFNIDQKFNVNFSRIKAKKLKTGTFYGVGHNALYWPNDDSVKVVKVVVKKETTTQGLDKFDVRIYDLFEKGGGTLWLGVYDESFHTVAYGPGRIVTTNHCQGYDDDRYSLYSANGGSVNEKDSVYFDISPDGKKIQLRQSAYLTCKNNSGNVNLPKYFDNVYITFDKEILEEGGVEVNASNFPDANFRKWMISNVEGADDAFLTFSEINKIKTINCSSQSISNLKGIEHLTQLTDLDIHSNLLKAVDLSKNVNITALRCQENQLSELNVSTLSKLYYLNCGSNQIGKLDLSKNLELGNLHVPNNKLSTLNLSKNVKIQSLYCYANQLTSLNTSALSNLKILNCSQNLMSSIDVSKNVALTTLDCNRNQLNSLDVKMLPALESLKCQVNNIPSIDVSNNTKLTYFDCGANQLKTLDVTKNSALKNLYCSPNQLKVLDISKNVLLETLKCDNNHLLQLDASNVSSALSTFVGNSQSYVIDAKLVQIDDCLKYMIKMPHDFTNDVDKKLFVKELLTSGTQMEIKDGYTVFYASYEFKPDTIRYTYFVNNGTHLLTVDLCPHYYMLGDVNEDGCIDVSDVSILIDKVLSGSSDFSVVCDVNEDGIVDVSDVTSLIDWIIG